MSEDDRAAELALCATAATGDERAIAELEARFFHEIPRALRTLDKGGDLTAEVTQVLRHKLFVATPAEPAGITRFEGRGPLGRWLQVVATREALMQLRASKRERVRAQAVTTADLADRDHELHVLRREYRAAFERAFADALAALSSKDRNLLYYHLVGRLGIDRLGALYRVHRVTAFRWLRDAREALVTRTRELLAARMQLAGDELDSLMRLVQSRASVSVERLLRQARTDSIPG